MEQSLGIYKKWLNRLRNTHSDHKRIASGMITVAFFVFIGKIAGAGKEMAVAWRYGISSEVDAYLFVFNIISWPISVWYSVLAIVLVPLATQIKHDNPLELPHFRRELLGLSLMIGVALAGLLWLGLTVLLNTSWVGLDKKTIANALEMIPAITLLAPLGIIINLFSTWMLSERRHANTLFEGVPSLVLLIAIVAFPIVGIEPLVWGTIVGYAFHLASLAVPLASKHQLEMPRVTHTSVYWSPFWQGFGIILISHSIRSFTGIIDQFFAANIGEGAISTLNYANRILALILGLGATAVSRATLPIFSKVGANDGESTQRIANYWIGFMFVFGIIAMITGWWLASWSVKLLFEHGAFSAKNTEEVSEVLRYGLIQLPFYFSLMIFTSLLASVKRHRLILRLAILSTTIKILATPLCIYFSGIKGIPLSQAVAYSSSLLILMIIYRKPKAMKNDQLTSIKQDKI